MDFLKFITAPCLKSGGVQFLNSLCASCYIGNEKNFITILSIYGMLTKLIEIINIMRGKSNATDIWRNRIKEKSHKFLSEENEKRIKVGVSFVYFEHNFLLLLSSIYGQPVFMAPWLIFQSVVFILEGFLFFLRMFVEKSYPTIRELVMLFAMSFVYLEVYCYQQSLLTKQGMFADW